MSALPYIPLYVADYLADTSHLSTLEHGAYLLLIMNYWQRGKPLPGGGDQLARIARVTREEWDQIGGALEGFFDVVDGQWVHVRIENELAKVHEKSVRASNAGKASAQQRSSGRSTKVKRPINKRSTDVEQTFNHTDTDTDTNIGDKSPILRGDGFQEFWEAYPKRTGSSDQAGAKESYYAVTVDTPRETIIAAATAYSTWCRENGKTGTQYVKSARGWLSEGHWREWEPKSVAIVPTGVLVKRGTPAWEAWQAVKKTPCSERHDGWFFPTEWPPDSAASKLLETQLMQRRA